MQPTRYLGGSRPLPRNCQGPVAGRCARTQTHLWTQAHSAHAASGRGALCVMAAAGKGKAANDDDDDDDDGEAPVAGKALRVERLLANLGYGKRRECQQMVKKGHVTRLDGSKLKVGEKVCWGEVVLGGGEELDPPSPMLVLLHKPTGYVVTSPDDEKVTDPVVYDLLPYRFGRRRPFLACVGRLDKDTSGLLLLTDDGTLLHRINSPKRGIWKVYEATLADPLTVKQAEAAAKKFASGTVVLEGDYTPLLPAKLDRTGERTARVAICEGRYHQVRRMFTSIGHKVVALHRVSVGALTLGSLPQGEWRFLAPEELDTVFEGPTSEDVFGASSSNALGAGSSSNNGASAGMTVVADGRDGGAEASTSGGSGKGDDGSERLTKKEKKKGRKEDVRAAKARQAEAEEAEEEEIEDVADVELLEFDEEQAVGGGEERRVAVVRRPRRPKRATVRQGMVTDGRAEGVEEEQEVATHGIEYDDEAADVVMSAGAGDGVRKYRDGDKWRRRRDALRELLPS